MRNFPGTFAQVIEVPNLFKGVNEIDIRSTWFGNSVAIVPSRLKNEHTIYVFLLGALILFTGLGIIIVKRMMLSK